MIKNILPRVFLNRVIAVASILVTISASYADNSILVQSTTSTANSGLYQYLLPVFEQSSGIRVNVVAVGTGQAIRNASNCDADVLLVHAKQAEEKFIQQGFGVKRDDLMYNDFVIVGPQNNPANIEKNPPIESALKSIATSEAVFASRGDNSGTHKKEIVLWNLTGIDPTKASGRWYRETGSGMGATLNASVGMNAYTLTDRATWISFNNKQNHTIVVEGDDNLFNQYGIILVSKKRCPNINAKGGQAFIEWMLGREGQQLIADYRVDNQQLFYPNATVD